MWVELPKKGKGKNRGRTKRDSKRKKRRQVLTRDTTDLVFALKKRERATENKRKRDKRSKQNNKKKQRKTSIDASVISFLPLEERVKGKRERKWREKKGRKERKKRKRKSRVSTETETDTMDQRNENDKQVLRRNETAFFFAFAFPFLLRLTLYLNRHCLAMGRVLVFHSVPHSAPVSSVSCLTSAKQSIYWPKCQWVYLFYSVNHLFLHTSPYSAIDFSFLTKTELPYQSTHNLVVLLSLEWFLLLFCWHYFFLRVHPSSQCRGFIITPNVELLCISFLSARLSSLPLFYNSNSLSFLQVSLTLLLRFSWDRSKVVVNLHRKEVEIRIIRKAF